MPAEMTDIPPELYPDVETLWDYHFLNPELRPCSIGLGLGGHDLGVATYAAELFHKGMFPLILFSGANAPTTIDRFPRGEAVHFREHAIELGVPAEAILIETKAGNTYENIQLSRELLAEKGIPVDSVLMITKPYQQRRSYAIVRQLWPEVDVISTARPVSLRKYVAGLGDAKFVIDMLVGDTEGIIRFPHPEHAPDELRVPSTVLNAYRRLVKSGFAGRRGKSP